MRSSRDDMKKGLGRVLFAPTHKQMRTPGGAADGTWLDSGVIRHKKSRLRKRLTQEEGGRRQVLNKKRMFEIAEEVWESIPLEDLRPYMLKVEKNWAEIAKIDGAWYGWSSRASKRKRAGTYRHGAE